MKEAEWMTLLLTSLKALIIVKEIDTDIYISRQPAFSALRWMFW